MMKLKRSMTMMAAAAATLAVLSGCVVAPNSPPPAYAPVARPAPVYVEYGRVENIGYIEVASRPSGAGAILGAVVGAVVGHQIGSGVGNGLATGAGAVGGALAGNAIEGRSRRPEEAYRVQVRFENGSERDFDFMRIDDLRVGDRVKFEGGQLHRL